MIQEIYRDCKRQKTNNHDEITRSWINIYNIHKIQIELLCAAVFRLISHSPASNTSWPNQVRLKISLYDLSRKEDTLHWLNSATSIIKMRKNQQIKESSNWSWATDLRTKEILRTSTAIIITITYSSYSCTSLEQWDWSRRQLLLCCGWKQASSNSR